MDQLPKFYAAPSLELFKDTFREGFDEALMKIMDHDYSKHLEFDNYWVESWRKYYKKILNANPRKLPTIYVRESISALRNTFYAGFKEVLEKVIETQAKGEPPKFTEWYTEGFAKFYREVIAKADATCFEIQPGTGKTNWPREVI